MSTSGNYEYKKVAGILTEAITDFESGQIDSVIIGIGINCSGAPDNFPADIRNSAGSIEYIAEKSFDRNLLVVVMIRELDDITNLDFDSDIIRKELISEYKEYSVVIDRDIFIYKRPYGGRGPGLDEREILSPASWRMYPISPMTEACKSNIRMAAQKFSPRAK